MTIWC